MRERFAVQQWLLREVALARRRLQIALGLPGFDGGRDDDAAWLRAGFHDRAGAERAIHGNAAGGAGEGPAGVGGQHRRPAEPVGGGAGRGRGLRVAPGDALQRGRRAGTERAGMDAGWRIAGVCAGQQRAGRFHFCVRTLARIPRVPAAPPERSRHRPEHAAASPADDHVRA